MEKKYCIKCGLELYPEERECPECGTPAPRARRSVVQPERSRVEADSSMEDDFEIPPRRPASKKPANKKKKKGLIIGLVSLFFIIVLIMVFGEVTEREEPAIATTQTTGLELDQEPEKKSENKKEDDFKDKVESVLEYHKEIYNGNPSDGASGSLVAFKINLGLYKSSYGESSVEYRSYYYAIYGTNDYIHEFGEDDSMLEEVQGYLYSIDSNYLSYYDSYIPDPTEEEITQSEQDYKASAITIDYQSLVREPYNYEGEIIKVTIKVSQVMSGGILTESGYSGKQNGNERYITYSLPEGTPRILEGDTVTFYGEFNGLKEMRRASTGVKDEIPNLKAKYHE